MLLFLCIILFMVSVINFVRVIQAVEVSNWYGARLHSFIALIPLGFIIYLLRTS